MPTLSKLKQIAWILALVVAGVMASAAQQPDDLQKQLEQLKQQYDATTRDLEQRIAALEQQIKKEKEKEENQAREKTKQGAISAVELAAEQAAQKAVTGESSQV